MNPAADRYPLGEHPIITAQQYFLEQQRQHFTDASGELSRLLSGLTLATKMIQAKVRRAGLVGRRTPFIVGGKSEMELFLECAGL